MSDKNNWKKFLLNSIIVLVYLGIAVFCVVTVLVNNDNMQEVQKAAVPLENVEESPDTAEHEEFWASFEGFRDITLCAEEGKQENRQPIKLFVQENHCYFFIPSYYNTGGLILHFDENAYILSLDGEKMFDGDRLNVQESGILDVEIPDSGAKQQYTFSIMQSRNLPAIFISTANKTMQYIHSEKDNTEPGSLVCIRADGNIDCMGTLDKIKMHGNTSLMCLKKTYQINFEKEANLLGMGSAKHWILQANAYDKSYLRNKLAYDLARQLGLPYGVEAEFADVYLNQEYAGCYLICEKVEAGRNRVDIPIPQRDANRDSADIVEEQDRRYYVFPEKTQDAEGYLIEANNKIVSSDEGRIAQEDCYFTVESGIYEIKSPKEAIESEVVYLTDFMENVEKLVAESVSGASRNVWERYIDLDSFAAMYLMDLITNEVDANDYSTFYYILQGKIYAGPAWDYDRAFGNEERNLYINVNGFPNGLCEELAKNKEFRKYVTDMFNQQAFLNAEHPILRYLEEAELFLQKSVQMNEIRWENDAERLNYSYNAFAEEVSYLKYYYRERLTLVNNLLNEPHRYHTITFTNSAGRSKDCWILDGEVLAKDILDFMKSQYGCMHWTFENGNIYQQGRPVFGDMILYAAEGD